VIRLDELKKSLLVSLWFMFLTFPIMVVRVNTIYQRVEWRWGNMLLVGIGSFVLSYIWRAMLRRKERGQKRALDGVADSRFSLKRRIFEDRQIYLPLLGAIVVFALVFPFTFSMYQTNIMVNALIYVMLGLGINIVVGLAGLLDLGYVAFYGAGLGATFGILLGYPVLRLRGDYLAIVTLGFGEIIRLVLENWNEFSFGPSGIANIPRPGLFGIDMTLEQSTIFIYFLMIVLVIFTIFVVNRLQNSRIGRAWIALREDEVACQAMGIDRTKTKLTAFSLGATWAGMAGVVFAAKTTFINPASFTIWESVIILCIVVLGGMGSIVGVIFGALVLILLPEYLRAFSEYRMLIFGAVLVTMMVFRPGGIVSELRRSYEFEIPQKRDRTGPSIEV
jgi:branched-chain amino acid transport system permease protein